MASVSGLSMSNATYARSASGLKSLVSSLQSDIDRAISYLNGSEYTTMINTISKYWSGVDADKFISELKAMINADATLFKTYKATVQNALDADFKYFSSSQTNIANSIKRVS